MKVITLSREYGAGGHTIGKAVAHKLGIEIYDKDIIKSVAADMGIDAEVIKKMDEGITRSENILRSITPISYDQNDSVYRVQKEIILKLASKGPCVILGRCANIIVREAGIPSVDVFIYADTAHRMERIAELIGSNDIHDITKESRKKDYSRHAYYETYTGHHWGNYLDFDLMLNSGELGYDRCVDIICEAAKD